MKIFGGLINILLNEKIQPDANLNLIKTDMCVCVCLFVCLYVRKTVRFCVCSSSTLHFQLQSMVSHCGKDH